MNWNWKGVLQAANQYGMDGYRPGVPQAPQGYVPYEATLNQRGLSNNMQPDNSIIPSTTYQPYNFGNRQPQAVAQQEAEQQAEAEALQRQSRIAEIESEIKEIETRIATNMAKLQNFTGNVDQIAAIEARKINTADPTSIWRWKVDRDEARRIAQAEKDKNKQLAKDNALYEIQNELASIIVDDKMDSSTRNAHLSKLAGLRTLAQKNGLDPADIDKKIKEVRGDGGEQTPREKAQTDWKGLKGKLDLTSNEIQTALDNPNMNWDPDERKEAENLRDKLKKQEAAAQSVKDMKADYKRRTGKDFDKADPYIQKKEQERWKRRNKK